MPLLSRDDAAHLLRRVGFGATSTDIDAYAGIERADAVDRVLDFTAAPPVVAPPGLRSADSMWSAWLVAADWWMRRMVTTPTPFQEKLTLFWHSHFAIQASKVGDLPTVFDQTCLLRDHALGDFGALCHAVAVDPAMLVYLNNGSNVREAPQENFARELMELYTLGTGAYDESDVRAMARAWTGHNNVGWTASGWDGSYVFRPQRHDDADKVLFGITRRWDGPDTIVEITQGSKQADCSRFVAAKLFRHLAHAAPTSTQVDELAAAFRAGGMEVRSLVRAILLHDGFWSAEARRALVKSPLELVVEVIRRTGVRIEDAGTDWGVRSMGQTLLEPPSVRGWDENAGWLSASSMSARMTWLAHVRWAVPATGLLAALEHDDASTGTQRIFDLLGIDQPSSESRAAIEAWFATCSRDYGWMVAANGFFLGAMAPEFHVK